MSRRAALRLGGGLAAAALLPMPALIASDRLRPLAPSGLQLGECEPGRIVLWTRADRPARLVVEVGLQADFGDAVRVVLNGKLERIVLVGAVLTPEYIYPTRGSGMPDDEWFAILWIDARALSAAFVPTYARARQESQEAAFRLANRVYGFVALVLGVLVVVGIVLAWPIVAGIAPGFDDAPASTARPIVLANRQHWRHRPHARPARDP